MAKQDPVPRLQACLALAAALPLLGACSSGPADLDLRGKLGGFSTTYAAQTATDRLPKPDSRGIISFPTYQVVVAREGDSIEDIAERTGMDAGKLAKYNAISPNKRLHPGELLALPERAPTAGADGNTIDIAALAEAAIESAPNASEQTTGNSPEDSGIIPGTSRGRIPIRHQVERGETVYSIARLYDVPVRALAEWNGLGPDLAVREGQFLLIPVKMPASNTPQTGVPKPGEGSPSPVPPSAARPLPDENVAPASNRATDVRVMPEAGSSGGNSGGVFAMPVQGRIVRDFERGRYNGIEIAATPGSEVRAAASGRVAGITQDTNKVSIIILEHDDGLLTIYAGIEKIGVKKDSRVSRGQAIARLPQDSDATLHFEVRQGLENVVDPGDYLG